MMSLLLLILKLLVIVITLIMFLRRPSLVWGIGLLSVTTAVLLDAFLGAFGREEIVADLGFFFYIISGFLFAGSTLWAWGILRPAVETAVPVQKNRALLQPALLEKKRRLNPNAAFDRQMLYDEIRHRFGYEDVLDLIFDLGLKENDVIPLNQDMNQLILNILDQAENDNQTGALALAVERILTPLPPENLPRLEKIDAASPPTVLRHYMLANLNLGQLAHIAAVLDIDWEQLAAGNKQAKVRSLLLFLYRRNRIEELIDYLHQTGKSLADREGNGDLNG